MKKLTPKQEMFCQEYLVDLNATQAAIRAGYSTKTAQVQGSQNLLKLMVQNKIQELMRERSDRTKVTVDKVIEGLSSIAFDELLSFCKGKQISLKEMNNKDNEKDKISIQEIKTVDRLKALEKLYNHVTGTSDAPTTNVNLTMNDFYSDVVKEKLDQMADDKKEPNDSPKD